MICFGESIRKHGQARGLQRLLTWLLCLQIDAKRSVPQEQKPKSKKIFVGGLAPETMEGVIDSLPLQLPNLMLVSSIPAPQSLPQLMYCICSSAHVTCLKQFRVSCLALLPQWPSFQSNTVLYN